MSKVFIKLTWGWIDEGVKHLFIYLYEMISFLFNWQNVFFPEVILIEDQYARSISTLTRDRIVLFLSETSWPIELINSLFGL